MWPDQSRVLLRPFDPGNSQRAVGIITRILTLPEDSVTPLLGAVTAEFSSRHQEISSVFLERYEQLRHLLPSDLELSEQRKLLIPA